MGFLPGFSVLALLCYSGLSLPPLGLSSLNTNFRIVSSSSAKNVIVTLTKAAWKL